MTKTMVIKMLVVVVAIGKAFTTTTSSSMVTATSVVDTMTIRAKKIYCINSVIVGLAQQISVYCITIWFLVLGQCTCTNVQRQIPAAVGCVEVQMHLVSIQPY